MPEEDIDYDLERLMSSGYTREQAILVLEAQRSKLKSNSTDNNNRISSPNSRGQQPIDVNRKEFYDNFDNHVNQLMTNGHTRESAFQIQSKLQNLDAFNPNITPSQDDEVETRVSVLMNQGYTEEQAIRLLAAGSNSSDMGEVNNRKTQIIEQQRISYDITDPVESFDPSEEQVERLMQQGYTREQAIRAIASSNRNGNTATTNRNESYIPAGISQEEDQSVLDPHDRAEIAVLMSRGYTRAEAILTIMAADEAEAIGFRSRSRSNPITPIAQMSPTHIRGESLGQVYQFRPTVPSPRIGTYFKAKNADDEALEMGILLSKQEAMFGKNMFDAMTREDDPAIERLIELGYAYHDAVLDIFELKYGHIPNTSNPSRNVNHIHIIYVLFYE